MIARDVQPQQEVLVDGEWLRATRVILTEREDGTNGTFIYFLDHAPLRLNDNDEIKIRTP